jgi:hypothetical protein
MKRIALVARLVYADQAAHDKALKARVDEVLATWSKDDEGQTGPENFPAQTIRAQTPATTRSHRSAPNSNARPSTSPDRDAISRRSIARPQWRRHLDSRLGELQALRRLRRREPLDSPQHHHGPVRCRAARCDHRL